MNSVIINHHTSYHEECIGSPVLEGAVNPVSGGMDSALVSPAGLGNLLKRTFQALHKRGCQARI